MYTYPHPPAVPFPYFQILSLSFSRAVNVLGRKFWYCLAIHYTIMRNSGYNCDRLIPGSWGALVEISSSRKPLTLLFRYGMKFDDILIIPGKISSPLFKFEQKIRKSEGKSRKVLKKRDRKFFFFWERGIENLLTSQKIAYEKKSEIFQLSISFLLPFLSKWLNPRY